MDVLEPPVGGVRHFLYFLTRKEARAVADELDGSWQSHTRKVGGDRPWELVVVTAGADAVEEDEALLERLADENVGWYDGREIRLADGAGEADV